MFTPFVRTLIEEAIKRHENRESLTALRAELSKAGGIEYANRLFIEVTDDDLAKATYHQCRFYQRYKLQEKFNEAMTKYHKDAEANAIVICSELEANLNLLLLDLDPVIYRHEADKRFENPPYAQRIRIAIPEKYISNLKTMLEMQKKQEENEKFNKQIAAFRLK